MKVGLVVALLASFTIAGFAQGYPISVGPYLSLNTGTNAGSIPTGYKTGVALTIPSSFGATGYMPFSSTQNIGATLDLGYASYGIVQKPESFSTDNNTYEYRYHYFAISPNLVASAFVFGFTFGIPLDMTKSNRAGNTNIPYGSETMTTLVEVHVGAMIPLFSDATGRLNLLITGGYGITGLTSSTPGDPTLNNPRAAALGLGFNYLFAVQH